MKPQTKQMNWLRGGENYISAQDGRFYISKGTCRGEPVYTLADGSKLVCTERGDGALERCKAEAERIKAEANV